MAKQFKSIERPKMDTEIPPDVPAEIFFPSNHDREPKYTSEPSVAERLDKIVEEEKTKEIYAEAYKSLKEVAKELNTGRAVLLSSAQTIDAIRPTFLYCIDKASEGIDKLKGFMDDIKQIESFTVTGRLDKESVEMLTRYNRIMVDQERGILKEHLKQLRSELDEYYDKVNTTIKKGECVCLPFKLFLWLLIIFWVNAGAILLIIVFSIW